MKFIQWGITHTGTLEVTGFFNAFVSPALLVEIRPQFLMFSTECYNILWKHSPHGPSYEMDRILIQNDLYEL